MHAYWIYPEQLEINVWRTFEKRVRAIVRGKRYAAQKGIAASFAASAPGLGSGANCLLLQRSSASLPLDDGSVDCVITDPPYGDNVNYAELADYWTVWNPRLKKIVDKRQEAVINRTQKKDLRRYGELLAGIFRECSRVLKPDGALVATFNSKDLEVVTAFLKAAAEGGFRLVVDGLLYQEPIKAYTTTVHAKEVGAFTGDFIFTFAKSRRQAPAVRPVDWKAAIDRTVERRARNARTEIEFRRGAYTDLIPLLAGWAGRLNGEATAAASYAERQVRARQFKALHYSRARSIAR
jgi:adenine-specific DNA methylase